MAHGLTIYDSPADALTSGQWPKVGPAVRQRGVATSRGRSIQSLLSRVSDRNLGRLGIQVQYRSTNFDGNQYYCTTGK
jgi:hypothetical protein